MIEYWFSEIPLLLSLTVLIYACPLEPFPMASFSDNGLAMYSISWKHRTRAALKVSLFYFRYFLIRLYHSMLSIKQP